MFKKYVQYLKFHHICPGTENSILEHPAVRHEFSTSSQQSRLFPHLIQHLVLVNRTAWSFEIKISKDSVEEEVAKIGKENPQKKVNRNIE